MGNRFTGRRSYRRHIQQWFAAEKYQRYMVPVTRVIQQMTDCPARCPGGEKTGRCAISACFGIAVGAAKIAILGDLQYQRRQRHVFGFEMRR
jgi:hypothetical protein